MADDKLDKQIIKGEGEGHASPINQKSSQGFGKGVNDYLNHYITVSDAKAVAFLALNFIIIQFLLKDHFFSAWGLPLQFIALAFHSLSLLTAAYVIFPRLPRGSKGLIFWEDIRELKTPELYETEVAGIQKERIEQEYAHQNFYISTVVHKKMKCVQLTISLFLVGTAFTVVCIVGHC